VSMFWLPWCIVLAWELWGRQIGRHSHLLPKMPGNVSYSDLIGNRVQLHELPRLELVKIISSLLRKLNQWWSQCM
jgi:hypothetical protein